MTTAVDATNNSGTIPPSRHTPGISSGNATSDAVTSGGGNGGGNRRGGHRRPGRGGGGNPGRGEQVKGGAGSTPSAAAGTDSGDGKAGPSRQARRPRNRPPKSSGNESSTSASSNVVHGQKPDSKDARQQAARPHRTRASRFNAKLTEKPADGLTEDNPADKYRNIITQQDDLTSTLIHSLTVPPYRDCLICFAAIRPFEPIWSCSTLVPTLAGSDNESDGSKDVASADAHTQCCWTPFHLKCIKQWASKSVKDVADAWRARGENRPGSWRCPGCQSRRLVVPNGYWCFCGSTADPKPPRLSTPHSCAANCSRSRACGHACPLTCHPGPCPPCRIMVQKPCFCGREILTFQCSFASSQEKHDNFSCGRTCDKQLACGNHTCQDTCHNGPCQPCTVTDIVKCYCGKAEKEIPCGEGEAKPSVLAEGAHTHRWIGRFACEEVCDRLFDCGVHRCEKPCHPQSSATSVCPRSPSLITHCPCSKHKLASSDAQAFPPGTKLTRTACTDPIPTCDSICMKPLEGCSHVCSSKCHVGPCPPCSIMLVRPCRCGSTTRDIRCAEAKAAGDDEILCTQACTALRACGKHQCNRICCPLASLASVTKGKGKKKATPIQVLDEADDAGWHQCDLVCGKMLGCGNHKCEEKDHKGSCPPCLRYSYEEMICYCGRTILEPPIPCGTRIVCSHPCNRLDPTCGHPKAPHHCHEDPLPCPPCVHLTAKRCACGKKMVDNVRCSQETISCGTICGRLLGCGFHHCERPCHGDDCGPCHAVCGKPRKLCLPAIHPCTLPCHAPSTCVEAEPCRSVVNISCACGRITQPMPCGRCTSSPNGREGSQQLKCTTECAIAKRNARLADALGISPDRQDSRSQVTYSEALITFARGDLSFCAMVEKSFADFITSEKRSQILPHMHPSRRKFVHDLAAVYRMDTQMVDQEPKRSVELIRRIDSRIPSPLLSSTISMVSASPASGPPTHGLGKLADLRAPAAARPAVPGRSLNASPAPSAASGRRAWTSVVARPQAPAAAQAASANAWRPIEVPPVERSQEVSRPSSSRLVQLSSSAKPSVTVPDRPEDVPDSWEDEA